MSTLASLLAQSKALTPGAFDPSPRAGSSKGTANAGLPALHLGLEQVEEQSRRLVGKKGRWAEDGEEGRAAHLLADAGLNLADLTARVQRATAPAALGGTFEPLIPLGDGDVDGYLRHTREQLILTSLSSAHAALTSSSNETLDSRRSAAWEARKRAILEEVGAGSPGQDGLGPDGESSLAESGFGRSGRVRLGASRADFGASLSASGLGQSTASSSLRPGQTLASHHRALKYSPLVSKLNLSRKAVPARPFNVLSAYASLLAPADASAQQTQGANPLLAQSFALLARIVAEGQPGVSERSYSAGYTSGWEGELGREVRQRIASGGKEFLEEQYWTHVGKRVSANPVQAGLGGDPSIGNRVRGYARVGLYKDGRWGEGVELVNARPLYAELYYLLRSGHPREALDLAMANEEAFSRSGERFFVGFLKGWLEGDRRLTRIQQDRLMTEYNLRIRHASLPSGQPGDPYKQALYRLIGRIDVRKNVGVARTTEDWLWFQLAFVREDATGEAESSEGGGGGEKYGLRNMARLVNKFGERHFDPRGERPVFWFQVLLFAGEFEKAIAFLYSKQQHQVDALQYAIGLAYYGLLRVPAKADVSDVQILTSAISPLTNFETSALNFARLIQRYVKQIGRSDPLTALQYIYLVCLSADAPAPVGKEQVELCHDAIRELVMDSGSYAELLGDIKVDGSKIPGAIERDIQLAHIADEKAYLLTIVKAAAARSSTQQKLTDAIILYNLAEDYDTVIAVLNRAVGSSLAQPSASTPSDATATAGSETRSAAFGGEQNIGALTQGILDHYQGDASKWGRVSERNRETCLVLLRFKEAFALYEAGRLEQALEAIESTSLLPLSTDIASINRRADDFRDLDEPIAHNFSDILIVTMNCLFKLHQALKESSYGGEARQSKMAEYRKMARSLTIFAGMLRYRMSQEVYQQLTRLDAFF